MEKSIEKIRETLETESGIPMARLVERNYMPLSRGKLTEEYRELVREYLGLMREQKNLAA